MPGGYPGTQAISWPLLGVTKVSILLKSLGQGEWWGQTRLEWREVGVGTCHYFPAFAQLSCAS